MSLNPVETMRVWKSRNRRVRDEVEYFQRRYQGGAHQAVLEKLSQADISRHYRKILVAAERALRDPPPGVIERLTAFAPGWFSRLGLRRE